QRLLAGRQGARRLQRLGSIKECPYGRDRLLLVAPTRDGRLLRSAVWRGLPWQWRLCLRLGPCLDPGGLVRPRRAAHRLWRGPPGAWAAPGGAAAGGWDGA